MVKITCCRLFTPHLHDNADLPRPTSEQCGNGGGGDNTSDNNNHGNGNRRRHGGGSNTGQTNTAVTANGMSSPTVVAPAPAAPVTAPSAPVTPPPAPVTSQTSPTPYNVLELPPLGIGYSVLAGSGTPGPLKFTMTLDCGVSSHFVDSRLIGNIESRG